MDDGARIDRLIAAGWRRITDTARADRWVPSSSFPRSALGRVGSANGGASGFTTDDAIRALDMAALMQRQPQRKGR